MRHMTHLVHVSQPVAVQPLEIRQFFWILIKQHFLIEFNSKVFELTEKLVQTTFMEKLLFNYLEKDGWVLHTALVIATMCHTRCAPTQFSDQEEYMLDMLDRCQTWRAL